MQTDGFKKRARHWHETAVMIRAEFERSDDIKVHSDGERLSWDAIYLS